MSEDSQSRPYRMGPLHYYPPEECLLVHATESRDRDRGASSVQTDDGCSGGKIS